MLEQVNGGGTSSTLKPADALMLRHVGLQGNQKLENMRSKLEAAWWSFDKNLATGTHIHMRGSRRQHGCTASWVLERDTQKNRTKKWIILPWLTVESRLTLQKMWMPPAESRWYYDSVWQIVLQLLVKLDLRVWKWDTCVGTVQQWHRQLQDMRSVLEKKTKNTTTQNTCTYN